jgi:hypothetical protein
MGMRRVLLLVLLGAEVAPPASSSPNGRHGRRVVPLTLIERSLTLVAAGFSDTGPTRTFTVARYAT